MISMHLVWKIPNMKKMIKEIVEKKMLVPTGEDQKRRKIPFTLKIIKKFFQLKFKMSQMATYFGK